MAFAPADFTAQWAPAHGRAPESGEFVARSIDLAPLALLSECLPLPEKLRTALVTMSPEGRFLDIRFNWTGELAQPDTFNARGRFADLGMQPYGNAPGFTHLSGQFDVSDKVGAAILNATNTTIRFAAASRENAVAFDALRARLQWSLPERREWK